MAESFMARQPDSLQHPEDHRPRRWTYEQGLMLESLRAVGEATGDPTYDAYIRKDMDHFIQPDGSIRTYKRSEYNLDKINPGRILLYLYDRTGEERFKSAADELRQQLREHPRTSEGGFWHKKVYPSQMWLDGIYMAEPFYARYAAAFGDTAAFDDIAQQIIVIEERTRDAETGLLYHAWDESKQQRWADPSTGTSPHFWGRAMGWYAMGIVDVLDAFPPDHPRHGELLAIFARLAEAIARYQDPSSGVWYQIVDQGDREGNYLEASCSAMFVYALAKGSRRGYIDSSYIAVAQKGFDGILTQFILEEGDGSVNLREVCAVAGLGGKPYRDGSFEYYVNEPRRTNDFKGVGPFILAALELGR